MRRSLLVGVAALLFGCGRGQHSTDNRALAEAAARPSSQAAADAVPRPTGDGGGSAAQSTQKVALIGCLQGSPLLETAGTAGTGARTTAPDTVVAGAAGERPSDRFILVDAVATPASAGVGANGAGGSGGPLVTGKSSFALDGIPASARATVNKQVRIVGRIATASGPVGTSAIGDRAASAASRPRGGTDSAPMAGVGAEMRRLIVETIDVVATTCP